jgi:hypothetical protein
LVRSRMEVQISLRRLHFFSLLRQDGTIFMSSYKNRTGEYWDPAGLITTLNKTGATYAMKTAVITQQELAKEGSPEFFEGELSYKAQEGMHRTGTDGIIQYVGAPVVFNSTVLGFVLFGHVISGDTILMTNSVALFGSGFSLVLFKDSNGDQREAVEVYIDQGLYTFKGTGLSDDEKTVILNAGMSVSNNNKGDTRKFTIRGTDYMVAYKNSPQPQVGANKTNVQAAAVLAVGHPLDVVQSVYQEMVSTAIGMLALCLIIDTIGMLVSVRLFIDPLDRLQTYVKLKVYKKYDSLLRELSVNKKYAIRVLLFSSLSIIVLIVMISLNSTSLQAVFKLEGQSSRQLKLTEYAYNSVPYRSVRFICDFGEVNPFVGYCNDTDHSKSRDSQSA